MIGASVDDKAMFMIESMVELFVINATSGESTTSIFIGVPVAAGTVGTVAATGGGGSGNAADVDVAC